jgi:hypothetical protein
VKSGQGYLVWSGRPDSQSQRVEQARRWVDCHHINGAADERCVQREGGADRGFANAARA